MPLFRYEVMNKEGKRVNGILEAKDKFALFHEVKQDGSTVVFAEEIKDKKGIPFITSLPFVNSVSTHSKIIFARNLGKMLDAGLPLTRGLTIMQKESTGQLKKILGLLNDSISKGNNLSEAMKNFPRVFSPLFVSMVKAGEESGNLSTALENVAMQIEKSYQLNRKIRGALIYPAVILSLMLAIGVVMMIYMVPTLTTTFNGLGIALPLSTRIIIGLSNFLLNYFPFVIIGTAGLIALFIFAIKSRIGQRVIDYVLLRTPILKEMVKQINSARTARTLSSLLSAGVDIVVAISVTKDVIQNSYYKEILGEVEKSIQKGGAMSAIFSNHQALYPVFVSEMASVGEETGKIGEMLLSVATFYEDEIDQKTKDLSSVIEPFLMIFIGLAVGFFAISVISPIYSIGDKIS